MCKEVIGSQLPTVTIRLIVICFHFHSEGDSTGTGLGGESIYDNEPFKDEFHSRLKFNRRGLLGLANAGEFVNLLLLIF